ncbi:MAG TPA: SDR family oxidoreductase [Rhizomicrobium sp.]|jgi:NAD(P)-dependent dehydrogenase (short-subunit alcohol dehydrogenase family)|nr:SDR family oxidoreductase [Rhizomicrobium sp.]
MTKTVLITGAAKRVGRAIALELAQAGYDIAIHYRDSADDAAALAQEVERLGRRAALVKADLENEASVEAMLPDAIAALGPITALVNNASLFIRDEVDEVTREGWDRQLMVNLRAPFVLIQHFARLLPAGAHGAIVNMLDQRVWNYTPHFVSYTVSKAGLWTLTQTMALALAPRIRVNGVGPGPILPNEKQSPEQFKAHWSSLPLQQRIDPAEVARTVHFLLESPSLTGQMIAVDGGEHLAWAQPKRGVVPPE